MRTTNGTITAALAARGATPAFAVTSQDLQPRLSQLVSPGVKFRSKAIITQAGTILIALVSQGADPNTVAIRRITDPTQPAQWSAAATTITSNAKALAGCGLVQSGSTIRCFYVETTLNRVVYRDSVNDGATWGAETVCHAQDPTVNTCVGIAPRSTTDVLFASYAYPQAACLIYRTTYSGSWSAITSVGPATPAWGLVRGLDCDNSKSPSVFVAGVQLRSSHTGIAACSATFDGTTWSAWQTIAPMDTPDNGLSYPNPAVHYNPNDGYYYVAAVRHDDGSISGTAVDYLTLYRSTDGLTWQLVQSLTGLQNEAHGLFANSVFYLADGAGAFNGPIPASPYDISADVLAIAIHEQVDQPTRFTITLTNKDGKYNSVPSLKDNAQLKISLGYNSSTILTHVCYIDALEYVCLPDSAELRIHGRDLTKFLDQICTKLIAISSQTVAQLATGICARANVPLATLPGTTQFSQVVPCFQITAGESWWQALLRLGAIYDFETIVTVNSGSPQVKLIERAAGDSSTWSYGQEAFGIAWQLSADQPNWVRVVGGSATTTNVFADAFDSANLLSSGALRYRHIVDRMVDTAAKSQLKANLALRDDQTQAQTGALTVRLNPQVEVMDVVSLTDSRLALSGQHARISTIATQIDFNTGLFLQHLSLELP
jgi:hypothetical protein